MEIFTAYLMAYFGPEEKLYYAVSRDARNWTALNAARPVFDAGVRLRDPFIQRVEDRYHLVHTKGWDHPEICHWESEDLIHWEGGAIPVVSEEKLRAWAPEFFYHPQERRFYVYWASLHEGHNAIHVTVTRDWKDIDPSRSRVWYDLGIHDIDLTIIEHGEIYYGFHKPGDVEDRMGNRLSVSPTLDPERNAFASDDIGRDVFPDSAQPTEGPEVIRLIGEERWIVYGDPFHQPMEAWETVDFQSFAKIPVSTPSGSKHCSMIPVTEAELERLLKEYPATEAR